MSIVDNFLPMALPDIPTPKDAGLPPGKFKEWRLYQQDAVRKILASDKKFFILEAPTGAGKSAIAIAVSNLMATRTGKAKAFYVASTKQLQFQLLDDFSHARTVMGRKNFQCAHPDYPALTAAECAYEAMGRGAKKCPYYRECEYFVQRNIAIKAQLSVHNYAYFLYARMAGLFNSCDLLILDEGHLAEHALMSFISYRFPLSNFRLAEIAFPSDNREVVIETLKSILPILDGKIPVLQHELELMEDEGGKKVPPETVQLLKRYTNLRDRLEKFEEVYEDDWLFEHVDTKYKSYIEFRPIWVDKFGYKFWSCLEESGKVLFMSATIGDVSMFCQLLGINEDEVESISLPSTFPKEHRPIVLRPVGKLSRSGYKHNWKRMVEEIDKIIDEHRGQKGLIHTISYAIAKDIRENSRHTKIMVFPSSLEDKAAVIDKFKTSTSKMVLVSPALGIGVDFEDDAARWQIIVKVPFASLGDEQVRMRLRTNDEWYKVDAANRCIQAAGRIVRSEEDWGITYLLDANFNWFFSKDFRHLFPLWFQEVVVQRPQKKG